MVVWLSLNALVLVLSAHHPPQDPHEIEQETKRTPQKDDADEHGHQTEAQGGPLIVTELRISEPHGLLRRHRGQTKGTEPIHSQDLSQNVCMRDNFLMHELTNLLPKPYQMLTTNTRIITRLAV